MGLSKKTMVLIFNSLDIGGIENRIVDITNYLTKHYPKLNIILCLKKPGGPLTKYIPSKIVNINSSVKPISRKLSSLFYPFWLAWVFKKYHPNIILAFGNYSAICGLIAKKITQINSTFVISEDSSIIEQINTDSYSTFRRTLVKLTYPTADKIITLSPAGKTKLISLIPSLKIKIVTIPIWLPGRFLRSINTLSPMKRDLDILFLGRFVNQKNPIRFIKIIKLISKSIPDINCAMVGYGPLLPKIKSLISKLNLTQNIQVFPATTSPASFFLRSKLFLLTSEHEGFPLVLLEANACHCVPVMQHLNELVHYYKLLPHRLFFRKNGTGAKSVVYLLNHPQLTQRIAKHYYQQCIHNRQKAIDQFISAINP